MLIIRYEPNSERALVENRVTLFLEVSEALDLIEKVAYLLRVPEYHHDHLEGGKTALDIVVLDRTQLDTYDHTLVPLLADYIANADTGG